MISIGPSSAMAAAFGASASMLSTWALISMFRAIGPLTTKLTSGRVKPRSTLKKHERALITVARANLDPSVSGVEGASGSIGNDALQAPRQRKPGLQRGQERSPYSLALELRVDIDMMDEGLRHPHRQEAHETTFWAVTNEYG